jgi:hypothetical protein
LIGQVSQTTSPETAIGDRHHHPANFPPKHQRHLFSYDGRILVPVFNTSENVNVRKFARSRLLVSFSLLYQMLRRLLTFVTFASSVALAQNNGQLSDSACPVTYFQLSDAPYENYFTSTCNFAATVVSLSPLPDSNLTLIGPRLIAAFPAGLSVVPYIF